MTPNTENDCPVAKAEYVTRVQCLTIVMGALLGACGGHWLAAKLSSPAPAAAVAGSAAPSRPLLLSPGRPAGGGTIPLSVYIQAVDRIWHQESRRGQDPRAARGIVGEHGELGERQVRPIWREDVERLTGLKCDPYNADRVRYQTLVWLQHYALDAGATTVDDLCDMYRLGPTGFRDRAAEQETP